MKSSSKSLVRQQPATPRNGGGDAGVQGALSKSKPLTVLDLFSGIGGMSLGLERTGGFRTVAFCEIEPFPRLVLAKHWPGVPQYDDVRTLTGARLAADGIAPIDVITGGFPCQPFSTAARGRNVAHDFWPEMARVVREARPRFVVAENVKRDPIARAADFFCEMGLSCDVVRICADDVGADHERSRWWAIAHPYGDGEFSRALDAEMAKLPGLFEGVWGAENYRSAVRLSDGLPAGLDGVAEYGNAVVPAIPELIGRAILAASPNPARSSAVTPPCDQRSAAPAASCGDASPSSARTVPGWPFSIAGVAG